MKRPRFAADISVLVCAAIALAAAGCATVDPRADFERAGDHVAQALGPAALYRPEDDAIIAEKVTALVADGVTKDDAVQVALLNNPRLQAAALQLGIGRAELVQSGLFTNPGLSFSLRWPDGGGLTNLQMGVAQNIAELWQIRHRRSAAERDLDRTVLEVARDAAGLALDARTAYWTAIRKDHEREMARESMELSRRLVDVAISRRDAGAGSDVDVNLARSQHNSAELRLRNASLESFQGRSRLLRLLGLTSHPEQLVMSDDLPRPADWSLSADAIAAAAADNRLDLRAAAMAAAAAESRVAYERTRYWRSLELGLSAERSARESRGGRNWLAETAYASAQSGQLTPPSLQPRESQSTDWVVGPEIGVELPIFDQNQAQIARAEYVYLQACKLVESLTREIAQEAYVAVERARTATNNVAYFVDAVLPLREQGVTLAMGAYTAGRTTLLTVQEAQRLLLEGRLGEIEARADYATAVVELERVAGRPFEALVAASAAPDEAASPQAPPENQMPLPMEIQP